VSGRVYALRPGRARIDCDRRDVYLDYVTRHPSERSRSAIDLSRRIRFRVVDDAGRPVNAARIVAGPSPAHARDSVRTSTDLARR
jgi:hypothetical protein